MLRAALIVLALALASAPAAASNAEQSQTLTIPQVRNAAKAALTQGDYRLALKLGRGLLIADPSDSDAHFIVAVAQAGLGQPRDGRVAARRAFQNAKRPQDKFFAAQTAARLSLAEKQYTLAQYWLRRSIDSAPNPELRTQTISDFRRVQNLKKLNWRASFSITPSDNVNSGADDTYLVIDGLPVLGVLSGASLALSGIVAKADVHASYRLKQSNSALWQLTGRAYVREIALTSASKALAPGLTSSDLSSATYEAGLVRYAKVGSGKFAGTSQVRFTLGRNIYARDPFSDYAKLSLRRSFTLTKTSKLSLGASYKKTAYKNAASNRADDYEIRADYERALPTGAQITTGFVLGQTKSQRGNTQNTSLTGYVSYGFANKIGPAKLSATLGARFTDYPVYRVGILLAPGGRQDKNLFTTLNMRFEGFEVAGFIPTASLQYYKTTSNISRFETDGASLSIGFSSNF